MGRKAKYSKELKLEIIKRFKEGEKAYDLSEEYHLKKRGSSLILRWVNQYDILGEKVFDNEMHNNSYSKEFKMEVISFYLENDTTYEEVANIFGLTSIEIVRKWVLKYNQGEVIADYNPKGDVYKMKSRKTTLQERLDIVNYVLNHDYDYKGAADLYLVPYSSIYQWVRKYLDKGDSGLNDHRGRPLKNPIKKELSLEEVQSIQIEKLEKDLDRQRKINQILKKNIEIKESLERDSRLLGRKMFIKPSTNLKI